MSTLKTKANSYVKKWTLSLTQPYKTLMYFEIALVDMWDLQHAPSHQDIYFSQ